MISTAKKDVHDYWQAAACGEELYLGQTSDYDAQTQERYRLEPYIAEFADFPGSRGRKILEIGVGLGADHEQFARAGASLWGLDLTERAVEHTRTRLAQRGLRSHLATGDAENLAFADDTFDGIYSWGVLHHSPDTARAFSEVLRVLKPGGEARIMIYHKHSMVGYMLWLRYAGLTLRWATPLDAIYAKHLESPGTKAYTIAQAHRLLDGFTDIRIRTVMTHGDLLESQSGQRHRGALLSVARLVWPRAFIRTFLPDHGLFMLITARKPSARAA